MLKFLIDKLEDAPEAFRTLYKEEDGKFRLQVAGLPETPDTSALENSLRAARTERDDFKGKLTKAEEKAADLGRKLEAKEATGAQTDEKISSMLAKWEQDKQAAVQAAITEAEQRMAPLTAKVTRYELDDKLSAAFVGAGGREERKARALTLAKQDGWGLVDGMPVRKDASGTVLTVTPEDYFSKQFKTEVPEFFKGSNADGGGATGGRSTAGTGNTKHPTQWSKEERVAYLEANGLDAYSKLLDQEVAASPAKAN